jgi:hypothetical protein
MAEFLDRQDQIIRQRLETGMQQWQNLAEIQIQQFHARLDGLLFQQQARLVAVEWGSEAMPLTAGERRDMFDNLEHDMWDDRSESQEANAITAIEQQMDRLHHREAVQGQHRGHESGIGY